MTYCLGILLPAGLVLASDSRSNAGVDQITRVMKLATLTVPGDRMVAVLSSGNLATTQAVVTSLWEAAGGGGDDCLKSAGSMFEAARIVGDKLRQVVDRDAHYVEPYGDVSANFLVGGQIKGEPPRLFQIYAAGNFVEASERSSFLQIGETKYGKPILDRALDEGSTLDEAAKLALLSFDATIRSNLSVGLPIDMLRYETDSFSTENFTTLDATNAYWREIRRSYGDGLAALIANIPAPPQEHGPPARTRTF